MRIKKLLSFLTASAVVASTMTAFTFTADAANAITDFSYKLLFTTVPTAGDTAKLKDADDNEADVMTVTYLGGTWKASGNGIAPNANTDRPTVSNGAYSAGCAIQFVPEVNGEVLVDRKLGSGKAMKVDENGKNTLTLTNSTSGSISTQADLETFTFDVEKGNTYIAYATGTGDPFYGIYFEPASSSTHVLSGAVNYTGSADTTGWKLVFTNKKDGSTLEAPFATTYSVDATQNREYDITIVDSEGHAPEATTIMLDTNSVYVGKEDVSFDINVVDFALTNTVGDVVVHDINNDGTSLDLSKVELTFTSQMDKEHVYTTGITENKIALELMPNEVYDVTATGADGYELSPLSKTYSMPAGDPAPFHNILFTETLGAVEFASEVKVGADKAYATINDAITAIKAMTRPAGEDGRVTVLVDPGTYTEQVTVDASYITIKAADETNKPVVEWYYGIGYLYYSSAGDGYYSEDYAVAKIRKGTVSRWGTAFRLGVQNNKPAADYVYLENINVRNTFNIKVTEEELADGVEAAKNNEYSDVNGKVERDAQDFDPMTKAAVERAAAITIDGAHAEAYQCEFISSQDTFYTGKDAYIKDCYIEGGTDFIFGGNSVVFDGCTLAWHGYSDAANGGYLTANKNSAAPGTADGNGYLFKDTTVTNSKYFTTNQFAAGGWGRNWGGANCQVVFDGVTLDGVDAPGAWVKMGGELNTSVLYVANVTKDSEPVDVAAANPNGTMEDNSYTEMAMTDYFGANWIPPHYDGAAPEPSETQAPETTQAPEETQKPLDPSEVVKAEKTVAVGNGVHWKADDLSDGTFDTTQEMNGLYIGAGQGTNDQGEPITKGVTVDSAGSSGTTIGATKYIKRIKTGGTGDPITGIRCFYFKPDTDCNMYLDATSASSSEDRDIIVIHGDVVEHLDLKAGVKDAFPVEGLKAGETVVIYSAEGGFNVYGIRLTTEPIPTPVPPAEKIALPANTAVNFDSSVEGTPHAGGTVIEKYVYIYGTSALAVDASNKTINGTKYTTRLKMGGEGKFNDNDGTPKDRVLSVIPSMDGTLVVDFANASSTDARSLHIKQGDEEDSTEVEGGESAFMSFDVVAGEEVYIYGSVNIYGIKLEVEGAPIPVDDSMLPAGTAVTFDDVVDSTYEEKTTILDYVTVYTNGSAISVGSTNKTVGDTKYTSLIKMGGNGSFNTDGTPKNRVLGVTPAADGTLTVPFVTGTSGEVRSLTAKQGDKEEKVTVGEDGVGILTIDVTAGKEVYLYATEGGVNIYSIALSGSSEPVEKKCIKVTASYKDGGVLDSVKFDEVPVSEAAASVKTDTSLVTYWDSLKGMKPVK